MRRDAHARRGAVALLGVLATAAALAGCGGGDDTTAVGGNSGEALEFAQWWEPELPEGSFQELIDGFEKDSGAKVKLLSGPYDSTKEQVVAGAATGTIPCVVGLDGADIYQSSDHYERYYEDGSPEPEFVYWEDPPATT